MREIVPIHIITFIHVSGYLLLYYGRRTKTPREQILPDYNSVVIDDSLTK